MKTIGQIPDIRSKFNIYLTVNKYFSIAKRWINAKIFKRKPKKA